MKYLVKSEAIAEIMEEIAKSRENRRNVERLKPIFIDIRYYRFVKRK